MTTSDQPLTRREFYDAILPNLATKEDLAKLETRLVEWMVGLMAVSIGVAATIAYTAVRLFGA